MGNIIKLINIGSICRDFRIHLGYQQYHVASAIGCSKELVSAFECGRDNNAVIFSWYIENGLESYMFERGLSFNG